MKVREIAFRGKRIKDGFWIYGNLIVNNGQPYIVGKFADVTNEYTHLEYWWAVEQDTVGQFTGLYDKHGTKIYEGDIVEVYEPDGEVIDWGQVIYGVDCNDKNAYPYHLTCKGYADNYNMYDECEYVVIGNIHDNPKLLEVKE